MKTNDTISVTIDNLGSQGEGVGRVEGFTVFVDGALPGEEVLARITMKKKRYAKGALVEVIRPSHLRVVPPCPIASRCGGCSLQHLSYGGQLEVKTARVRDAFCRIGGFTDLNVPPCFPSPSPFGYRNKVQVPIFDRENGLEMGFYAKRSRLGVPMEECLIHAPLGDAIYRKVKRLIQNSRLPLFNPEKQTGVWRHLLLKAAIRRSEALVTLITGPTPTDFLKPFAEEIRSQCPEVRGVLQNINGRTDNTILGNEWRTLAGEDSIEEELGGLTFALSGPSFFQVNPPQAEAVYQWALDAAELSPSDTLLDAFCGIGTLSLLAAQRAKSVTGIECVPEAIEDAKNNAKRNGMNNTSFLCGTVENLIPTLPPADVVLLNPPRKGCEESVLHTLSHHPPKRIVYISCDPATLARDAAFLQANGFSLRALQPFDMFPQTPHVETVAFFEKAEK